MGAGEVIDFIDFHIQWKSHVMSHQLKPRILKQVGDIFFCAGVEIIYAQHIMSFLQKKFA